MLYLQRCIFTVQLTIIFDLQMLVKPAGKVLDFRTEVTGATETTMQVSQACQAEVAACLHCLYLSTCQAFIFLVCKCIWHIQALLFNIVRHFIEAGAWCVHHCLQNVAQAI